jgi:PncC family amidohydrolase
MTLAEQLGTALMQRRWTIATVESCTGGGLAYRITTVPGASAYYLGSIIAYANRVKASVVGVPLEIFDAHGAVSAQAAESMAMNGRVRLEADLCLAITGIAGPGGATPGKSVGTVFISASGPAEAQTERFDFAGDREAIRQQAIDAALTLALELLTGS